MFTFDVQKKPDGKFYTAEPLRYPTKIGISGQCMSQNIEMVVLNEPRKSRLFQPEIDNCTGAGIIRNVMIGT